MRLREFPEISREELFRFFTLTPADIAFVAPGGGGDRRISSVLRSRCARCWGWGSFRTRSPPRRRPGTAPTTVSSRRSHFPHDGIELTRLVVGSGEAVFVWWCGYRASE